VANVLPLDAHEALASYFAAFMLERRRSERSDPASSADAVQQPAPQGVSVAG
jgi:hypothetical protein